MDPSVGTLSGGMVTLLVGVLVVVVGAVGFGIALFGPRPVPQPATEPGVTAATAVPAAEVVPSTEVRRPSTTELGPLMPTARTRGRAALWLVLAVVGTAAIVGTLAGLVLVVVTTLVG